MQVTVLDVNAARSTRVACLLGSLGECGPAQGDVFSWNRIVSTRQGGDSVLTQSIHLAISIDILARQRIAIEKLI